MKNIKFDVLPNQILVINVDLTQRVGPSASGKSILVGTTGSSVDIPGYPGMKLSVNVFQYTKPRRKKDAETV